MAYIIGVDIGGTRIRTGVLDGEEGLLYRREAFTLPEKGPADVIERLKRNIWKAYHLATDKQKRNIVGIGVGCPGPVSPFSGKVLSPPNLQGWENVPLKDIFGDWIG